jgi:TPR repeat protein
MKLNKTQASKKAVPPVSTNVYAILQNDYYWKNLDMTDLQTQASNLVPGDKAQFKEEKKFSLIFRIILKIEALCELANRQMKDSSSHWPAAIENYKKAMTKAYIPAYVKLGKHLFKGKRTKMDCKEAAKLFAFASEQKGDAEAFYRLGKCYLEGKGVKQDTKKAITHLQYQFVWISLSLIIF